jgi:hypothetical protein
MIDNALVSDLTWFGGKDALSMFFIKQSVFEESSKCPIPTNKHPGRSILLSVAGELLNASLNQSADVILSYTRDSQSVYFLWGKQTKSFMT